MGVAVSSPPSQVTQAELDLKAGISDAVPEGVSRLVAFGHSYLTGGGTTHPDHQYLTQLAGLWRAHGPDLAIGGACIAHDENWLGNNASRGGWAWVLQNTSPLGVAPYAPEGYMPFIHFGGNDITHHSQDAIGAPRTIFKTALRTVLSRLCAATIHGTDATVALAGLTWQAVIASVQRNSGADMNPIPGNGATITITLPADFEGGTVAVGFTVWPASDGQIAWTGTAAIGSPAATQLAGLAHANGGAGSRRDSSNGHVVRFTGLTAADAGKTIIGTYSAGAGTAFATPNQQGVITQGGTPGATTYGYKRVYRTYNGDTIPSTERTTATGNAALSATNFNTIPAGPAWPAGVEAELILRTTGPSSPGLVGVLTAGPAAFNDVTAALGNGGAYTAATANPLLGGAAYDYWQIEANNPVTRGIVIKANRLITYANGADAGDITDYNADIDSVVAEFAAGQFLAVDIDTALGATASLFAADGVHPNDRGHAVIAKTINAAVAPWLETLTDKPHQARIAKSVSSRRLYVGKYAGDLSLGAGTYVPANGVIAAANLPFTGTGTADYTLDTTTRLIDTTNLALPIDALPFDDIEVELAGQVQAASSTFFIDACFLDAAGAVIRWFSANPLTPTTMGSNGWPAWSAPTGDNFFRPITGKAYATVTAAELVTLFSVPGQVRIAIGGRAASGRVIYGGGLSTSLPIAMAVKNVGRRNVGFNAS